MIVCRDDLAVAHDGSEGVSPEGWLPDRVSIGALTKTFPPELVDRVVDTTGTREVRRRLLPARLHTPPAAPRPEMSSEQMTVLKMLEEGRISPEEADSLLKALGA